MKFHLFCGKKKKKNSIRVIRQLNGGVDDCKKKKMSNIVKTLEQLNSYSCRGKRNLLLRNMKVNQKYSIVFAQRHVKRKSRKSVIKLVLDNYYIYLPKRFNSLSDDFLNEINCNKEYMIQSCGQWKNTYNLVFSNLQTNEPIAYNLNDLLKEYEYYPEELLV